MDWHWLIEARQRHPPKAHFRSLLDAILAALNRADLTCQPTSPKTRDLTGKGLFLNDELTAKEHGQIGGRLVDADAAYGVDEDVMAADVDPAVTVEHGQEQCQALVVQPDGKTLRHPALHGVDERLSRPAAAGSLRPWRRLPSPERVRRVAEEERRGVRNAFPVPLGHPEHAEFVGRTEPVLDCADQPEASVRVALEIPTGVHDVLEHARRPAIAPSLVTWPTKITTVPRCFAASSAEPRTRALRDAAGRRGERLGVERLDRVDDDDLG